MKRVIFGLGLAAVWLSAAALAPEAAACSQEASACGDVVYPALVKSRASDSVLPSAVTVNAVVASKCSETSRNIAFDPHATTNLPEAVGYELSSKGPLPAGVTLPTTPITIGGDWLRLAYTGTEPSLSFTLAIVAVEADGDRGPSSDVQIDVTFPTEVDNAMSSCLEPACMSASASSTQGAWVLAVLAFIAVRRRRSR
ncbi:MAG: hypothetical protein KBG15_20330 [Kofleriaceae bacterium]|nr:hypothetical protein [Kofleriaceae bacterium]